MLRVVCGPFSFASKWRVSALRIPTMQGLRTRYPPSPKSAFPARTSWTRCRALSGAVKCCQALSCVAVCRCSLAGTAERYRALLVSGWYCRVLMRCYTLLGAAGLCQALPSATGHGCALLYAAGRWASVAERCRAQSRAVKRCRARSQPSTATRGHALPSAAKGELALPCTAERCHAPLSAADRALPSAAERCHALPCVARRCHARQCAAERCRGAVRRCHVLLKRC